MAKLLRHLNNFLNFSTYLTLHSYKIIVKNVEDNIFLTNKICLFLLSRNRIIDFYFFIFFFSMLPPLYLKRDCKIN